MHSRDKCLILAAVATMTPLPDAELVQRMKHNGKKYHFMRTVLADLIGGEPTLAMIDQCHDNYKRFKKLDDKKFIKKRPDLHHLWNNGVANAITPQGAAAIKTPPTPKTKTELIVILNALRKKQSMKTLDPRKVKDSVTVLEKRCETLRRAIAKDVPVWKVYPTAVAEGAYEDDRMAQHRTGHTISGPSRAVEKKQAKNARFIAQRHKQLDAASVSAHTIRLSELKGGDKLAAAVKEKRLPVTSGDIVSLSDIAKSIGMDGKTARRKARLHSRDIGKLQIKGEKYKFNPKDIKAIAAILQRDGRK